MIPILYPADSTSWWSNNGLGGLPDAINCIVTEQRNTAGGYWLEMDYPVDGLHFDLLAPERIIYAAPAMGQRPQPFRISRITRPINGIVHIEAPHISVELQKLTTFGTSIGTNIGAMGRGFFAKAREIGQSTHFDFASNVTASSEITISHLEPVPMVDVLLGAEGSILDLVGGEYEFDEFDVVLHAQRGVDSGLEIRYGVNMSDLEAETDATELVTACVPFWKGTVNEQDVVVTGDMCEADNADAYAYVRCVPLDVSEQFDLEQDEQPTAAQVTAKGQAFINSTSRKLLQTSIRVSYEPTTSGIGERRINLCDTVRVVYPDLNVSSISKVVETKFNTLTERYDELTIGTIRNNIVDTIAGLISGGAIMGGGGSSGGGGGSAVGAVLYNMAQSLNEAQKAQARSNIGVGSGGGIDYPPFTSDDSGKSLHIIGETVQWNQYYVTPEQFGAYGDGDQPNPHDDTKAIQAAFDAAANGGTVKFGHKKTYLVSKENGGLMWVSGGTKPSRGHYMLKIHGSITILGNGSTIIEPAITQEVYDAEYPIKYDPNQSQSASMIFIDNAECRSGSAADNPADFNDRNYVIIRGLVLEGNCKNVDRNLDHGGGAGAWWKAIYANSARGCYLELNSVTVRNFAAEGVYAQNAPGSKFRAFGCTFENCTPSAWNVGGSLAEAIGCTFNCTDPTSHASEYVSQKTIFDSCTFTSETMRPVLMQTTPGQELIVRNSVFNISATRKGIATIYYVYYDDGFVAEKYFHPGTVYLFARSSGNTFALATELQDGHDFLIVNVDEGSGYALAKNTDGSLKSVAVTISSDSITLSDTSAVWVCSANTNGFVLKNYEKNIVPSDSEDEGGEHQGDELDAYLTCNATYGLLTSSNFASTRWWSYSDENQLKLRITPPQENPIVYAKTSNNMCFDSCVINDERASNEPEAVLTTKSWVVGKVSNCTFNRTTMGANSVFNVLFVGQAQNNIVRVTNYPIYPDGASIIGRGLLIRLTGRSKYKFNMISAPRTFTIVPSENCNLIAWGFGTRVINVNVPVYAHTRAQFNVDYSSLPSAPYYNKYLAALRNFFVECDKPFNIIIET